MRTPHATELLAPVVVGRVADTSRPVSRRNLSRRNLSTTSKMLLDRRLRKAGKKSTVATTAVARELDRLHVGHRPTQHANRGLTDPNRRTHRRGRGPRQGNARLTFCGRHLR
jgi:hypothetical protein